MPPPGLLRTVELTNSDYAYVQMSFVPSQVEVEDLGSQLKGNTYVLYQWDALHQEWKEGFYEEAIGWWGDDISFQAGLPTLFALGSEGYALLSIGGILPSDDLTQIIYPGLNFVGSPQMSEQDLTVWNWHLLGQAGESEDDSDKIFLMNREDSMRWLQNNIDPMWVGAQEGEVLDTLSPEETYIYESVALEPFVATGEVHKYNGDMLPRISSVFYDEVLEEVLITVKDAPYQMHVYDLFYQDLELDHGYQPEDEWKVWQLGMLVGPGEEFVLRDDGSAIHDHPQDTALRLYQVGNAFLDSDRDGLRDMHERLVLKTDPENVDSDFDGVNDGWEFRQGMDPADDLSEGLFAHYTFDDEPGSTQVVDSGGGSYHATTLAPAVTDAEWGPLLGAESFSGGVDGLILSERGRGAYHTQFEERSVCVWFKTVDCYPRQVIYEEGASGAGFVIQINKGRLRFGIRSDSEKTVVSTNKIKNDHWHHVVAIFNGDMELYVDGKLVDQEEDVAEEIGSHSNAGAWAFSNDGNSLNSGVHGEGLKGSIDDGRIYAKALTPGQVQELYRLGADSDGDGYSTYHEYLRGTDPQNANSKHSWLYVSPVGSDTWTGWTSAYQTKRHGPLKTLDVALAKALAGDAVQIDAATYTHGGVVVPAGVTLQIKPEGKVVLQPAP
ncbi:LamG domain-containing protein [Kiritimatiellota bacterium B12222]|nr:LamG domain-containing protein [Kiritimatiellota bacterium B12222]